MEHICGECKWHRHCKKVAGFKYRDEWVCMNKNADAYTLPTDYTDTCEEWEGRE